MPLYYLHIRDGDKWIEDPDGSLLPGLDAAREEALMSAREILADRLKAGQSIRDGQRFEIVDEGGTLRATIPLRDALGLD